jgi:hypothetical protein
MPAFSFFRTLLLSTLATTVPAALGAASPAATSDANSEAATFLARIAGVYKQRFANGLISGEKFQSEDILEVVPVDNAHAYIRMHLEFYNGHMGAIYGVATYSAPASLVYDDEGKAADGGRCVLTLTWSTEVVKATADYEKTPGCRNYHGARGYLNGIEFKSAARRNIRYLQRLRDSSEFKSAMDKFSGRRAIPPGP